MYPYVTRMVPVCTRVVFWSRSFTLHYTPNIRSRGKLLVLFSRENIFFLH